MEDPEAELKVRLCALAVKDARIAYLRDHVAVAARVAMEHLQAAREAQLSSYAVQANATQRDQLLKKLQREVQASVLHNEQLLRDRIATAVLEYEQQKKVKLERGESITATTTIAEKQKPKDKDHTTRLLKDAHPELLISGAGLLTGSTSMKSEDSDDDDDDDDDDDNDNNEEDLEVVVDETHAHVRFVDGISSGLANSVAHHGPPHSGSHSGSHSPNSGAYSPGHSARDKNMGYDREKGNDAPEWMEFRDPSSGKPYWVNTINGDTTVENPFSVKNSAR